MIFPSNRVRIMVATKPIDFRKGHDSLAAMVKNELRKDPFTGTVFVFRAKKADRLSFYIQTARFADRVSVASAFWSRPARPRWGPQARRGLNPRRGPSRIFPNLAALDVRSRLLFSTGQRAAPCRA